MALTYDQSKTTFDQLMTLLQGSKRVRRHSNISRKAGAPVNNTDIPRKKGDFCLDTTNNAVYVCTVTNLTSTSTWAQLV